eukprot:6194679-Pleurochrysis_carterae.AAC.1
MPMRSLGFLAFRLHETTLPCSVPTKNLVGPAAAEYSIETPPIVLWPCAKHTRHDRIEGASVAHARTCVQSKGQEGYAALTTWRLA